MSKIEIRLGQATRMPRHCQKRSTDDTQTVDPHARNKPGRLFPDCANGHTDLTNRNTNPADRCACATYCDAHLTDGFTNLGNTHLCFASSYDWRWRGQRLGRPGRKG